MRNVPNREVVIVRTMVVILYGCLLIIAIGCESGNSRKSLGEEVKTLRQENRQLQSEMEQSRTQVEQLKKQVEVLSGLKPGVRLGKLYDLQRVKVTRYTNLYDKDKDDRKESLIVYLQPIDEDGDIVKATGAVDVQLWDLNKAEDEALLAEWHVKPEELKELWFATIITVNYRLTFDVSELIEEAEEALTVKVTFTDYLSGKVFKEQKVIKP